MARIYATEDKYESDVIKAFLTNDKYDADLWFYKVDDKYNADNKDELWFFTDDKYDATAIVCWVNDRYDADLIVYRTNDKYDVKWNRGNKFVGRIG